MFGLAAAASTMTVSRGWRDVPPRRLWAGAQVVMAAGVLAPSLRMSVATLLWCALCVGGTFMVVTMAGIQEARRDLVALIGYFTTVSMALNVAHTPSEPGASVALLPPLPR